MLLDRYEPRGEHDCSLCGERLTQWQGKDGPCLLLLYREGESRTPVEHLVEPAERFGAEQLAEHPLPDAFELSDICSHDHCTVLRGTCTDGSWTSTTHLRTFALS